MIDQTKTNKTSKTATLTADQVPVSRPQLMTQPIDPDLIYTIEQLAATLDVAKGWVLRHMLRPTDGSTPCRHFARGNCILILGRWVEDWIRQEMARATASD